MWGGRRVDMFLFLVLVWYSGDGLDWDANLLQ
jgi:hypothetical protein